MFAYVYVIRNNMYPNDVYKLEISRQNIKQLYKKYNKYYMDDIHIVNIFLVSNEAITQKFIQEKLGKYYINDKKFIKCDLNKIIKKLKEIENLVNSDNNLKKKVKIVGQSISNFMSLACKKNINENIPINEFYDLFNKNKNMDYLEFMYIIKKYNDKDNIVTVNIDNNHYIKNYSFLHKNINIYDQYIKLKIKKSKENFTSITSIIDNYKLWHAINYSYLKIQFKVELKKNIIKNMEKKFGNIIFNKYSTKCRNGWWVTIKN